MVEVLMSAKLRAIVNRLQRVLQIGQSERSVDAKLKAVREAVQYNYPTADVEEMLKEIGAGYLGAGDKEFPAS